MEPLLCGAGRPVDRDAASCDNRGMNRRYLIAAGILAAGIIAVLAVIATLPESPVSKAAYERIENGMTSEQVQAVVGMPPKAKYYEQSSFSESSLMWWSNPDGSGFQVVIDGRNGVCDKTWIDSTETIGEKVRRWVRWPW
jgi:hypothetical protein